MFMDAKLRLFNRINKKIIRYWTKPRDYCTKHGDLSNFCAFVMM